MAVSLALLSLGVVAVHDPGPLSPDPDLAWSYPAYAHLSEAGRLPLRVLASLRDDALDTALAGDLRSGAILGANPDGRARIGWQKCFADGSLGSRTAALLADIEPEPDRPLPPDRRRGVWMTEPDELRERVERAAAGGISSQVHAIGDAAVRAALDVLAPTAGAVPFMPRIEHVQLLDPADRGRFAAAGIAASVQPVASRHGCGAGATAVGRPRRGQRLRLGLARGDRGGPRRSAPTRRSSRSIRGRASRSRFGARTRAGRPGRRRSRRARRSPSSAPCAPPASTRRARRGTANRGRLTVGQRADVVVIPAASLDEPVEPGGALASTRPSMVLVDGRVVFEA